MSDTENTDTSVVVFVDGYATNIKSLADLLLFLKINSEYDTYTIEASYDMIKLTSKSK